ncbi:hypothetical protein [Rhodopirellula sp. SWK7]|uniref:hypothetical protein n=1 Tax=Rhodopirellula sp. SWK7 TaxID=595460 RepID=UPI0002BD854D|nr:hypothetical protein [Rhodopirellula sp. SWK7]EMI40762.1 hypothetical protein RRSWK_06813 [Rhodopirellula sp. SWK7]
MSEDNGSTEFYAKAVEYTLELDLHLFFRSVGERHRRLHGIPQSEMFKWNLISDQILAESEPETLGRDRMRLAFYYQSLLDSGELSTRAELSRHLRESRSRVTQVLNRLNETDDESATRRFGDSG